MRALILAGVLLITAAHAYAQSPATYSVVFDPYMTPAAGAQGLLTIQHLFASAADRWLPLKIGSERSRPGLALGILYRSGKFLLLDMPQDHFFLVAAHEVFGHGTRFREIGDGRLRYGFDAPIPYGSGDAFTRFHGLFPVTPLAELTVSAAGIEAQHALADAIADRAAGRGRIHYREAWLYFESRMAAVSYALSASPTSSEGHDVADYLEAFEKACTAPCTPLTRNHVQRRSLAALVDPLLYYSLYGLAVSYIGNGQTTGPLPMIPVGRGAQVMPSLGYALAPYGGEWSVRGVLVSGKGEEGRGKSVHGVTVRVGNTGASPTWGVSARAADVARIRRLGIGVDVHVWQQPEVLADKTSDAQSVGGGVLGTLVVPMPRWLRTRWSDGIHVTGGYKSEGFVPGEQLSGGAVLRLGFTVR
ncbi:MAG TPA: hypothetical protein VFO48_08240 [Vicinamibacterales bacterium]|nr:hypothetical protein [Vicinamibacterales bacterium]